MGPPWRLFGGACALGGGVGSSCGGDSPFLCLKISALSLRCYFVLLQRSSDSWCNNLSVGQVTGLEHDGFWNE